jgi:hypothetical protein
MNLLENDSKPWAGGEQPAINLRRRGYPKQMIGCMKMQARERRTRHLVTMLD